MIRLLEVLETLAYLSDTGEQAGAVKAHIDRVIAEGENADFGVDDRADFSRRVQTAKAQLGKSI